MAGEQEQQNEGGQGGEPQEHDDFGGASEAEIAEARAQGWKPKADLGDDKRWVDAKTFVQRGRTFNSRLQQQVASLTEQVQAFEGTKKQVIKFYEDSLKRQKSEFDDAIATVRRQKVEATQNGDTDAVLALEDRLEVLHTQKKDLETEADTLKKDLEVPAKRKPSLDTPATREDMWPAPLKEWVEDGNDWFRTDPKLAAYAVALGDELRAKGETSKDREFLDKVKEALIAEMPHKFQNGNRQRPGPSGGGNGKSSGGKTLKDLPEDDRKLAEQFIANGWHTEKSFLDSYFSR